MGQEQSPGGLSWGKKKSYIPATEEISQRPGSKKESTFHSTFFLVACLYQNYLSMCLENKRVQYLGGNFKINLVLMMRGQETKKQTNKK